MCLISCDIPWDEEALTSHFSHGLQYNMKALLLNFHEDPKSLVETISCAMLCYNRLFERHTKHQQLSIPRLEQSCLSDSCYIRTI